MSVDVTKQTATPSYRELVAEFNETCVPKLEEVVRASRTPSDCQCEDRAYRESMSDEITMMRAQVAFRWIIGRRSDTRDAERVAVFEYSALEAPLRQIIDMHVLTLRTRGHLDAASWNRFGELLEHTHKFTSHFGMN